MAQGYRSAGAARDALPGAYRLNAAQKLLRVTATKGHYNDQMLF